MLTARAAELSCPFSLGGGEPASSWGREVGIKARFDRRRWGVRKNLIWIFSDQHRAQAMGCVGDPNACTPNIDRMARRCRMGIGGSPLCSPFRGSLLTSQYPHNCVSGHDQALPENAGRLLTHSVKRAIRPATSGSGTSTDVRTGRKTRNPRTITSDERDVAASIRGSGTKTTTHSMTAGSTVTIGRETRFLPSSSMGMRQML